MQTKNEPTKETLLSEIEALIAYGRSEPTIHPDLLAYLEIAELQSIKQSLTQKVGRLSSEESAWLEQFKKYE